VKELHPKYPKQDTSSVAEGLRLPTSWLKQLSGAPSEISEISELWIGLGEAPSTSELLRHTDTTIIKISTRRSPVNDIRDIRDIRFVVDSLNATYQP
jgi:hypothetical protein